MNMIIFAIITKIYFTYRTKKTILNEMCFTNKLYIIKRTNMLSASNLIFPLYNPIFGFFEIFFRDVRFPAFITNILFSFNTKKVAFFFCNKYIYYQEAFLFLLLREMEYSSQLCYKYGSMIYFFFIYFYFIFRYLKTI